jgi:shikimate dehydrogenase
MNGTAPALIVTLPGTDIATLREQAVEARDAGASVAEVRVDRLDAASQRRVAELFPSPVPLLATYRSRAEGGAGADDPVPRRAVFAELARLPFSWIDLELRRDLDRLPELPPVERLGRIVSCHLAAGEIGQLEECLRQFDAVAAVGKVVVGASVEELTTAVLPLLAHVDTSDLVVHTTGSSGPFLRALARRFRFPFVYAALPARSDRPSVEPSQIPADRLAGYLAHDPPGPLFAVAGRPVGHSRSPALHSRWMRADRRNGLYVALDLADEREFLLTVSSMETLGLRGMNVTHPFKRAALEASDVLGGGAEACGVVNCLTREDGELRGENTDLAGILRRLDELRARGLWPGEELVVVGAGGAARATLAAARSLGVRARLLARNRERGEGLAREFGADLADPARPQPTTLLVHATTVGRAVGDRLDDPLAPWIDGRSYLLDWVYEPADPTIASVASERGARYEDGWHLLVYQGAASYALWWGSDPPRSELDTILTEGRCEA